MIFKFANSYVYQQNIFLLRLPRTKGAHLIMCFIRTQYPGCGGLKVSEQNPLEWNPAVTYARFARLPGNLKCALGRVTYLSDRSAHTASSSESTTAQRFHNITSRSRKSAPMANFFFLPLTSLQETLKRSMFRLIRSSSFSRKNSFWGQCVSFMTFFTHSTQDRSNLK